MQSAGRLWRGAVPAEYTTSPYPLQYYFEVKEAAESSALYPGLGRQLTDQPYFIARRG
jgi:hypothetical protein